MPIASRTFRVFVSSTFEDLIEERNALQREVFPALSKLCEAHGARFQAIDLRWGVRDEAVLGQKMMEICLAEIERCQRTRIKPNFIVLLGDRYGKPPLPARVQAQEFEALLSSGNSDSNRALMERWYQRDDNAVPAEYLLKPRTGEFVDANRWKDIEEPLGEALRRAARAAGLAPGALLKYEGSASHQEIVKGLGTTPEDRRHTFAFHRRTDGAKEPSKLTELKSFLRAQLGETAVEYNSGDIGSLCKHVVARLSKVILEEVSRFESRTALGLEVEAHDAFARERSLHFTGRSSVLDAITDYLKRDDRRPLVVHGASGSGKTAIIARASEGRGGIRRFIGATPEASNGLTLLRSLCEEIGQRYGQTGDLPATFNELIAMFENSLRLATADRPLVLYIDALDQLGAQDPAAVMNWLPSELPPHCRVVLSTIEVPAALGNVVPVPMEPFSVEEAGETLDLWLKDARRTLQEPQREKLMESFVQTGLPFYLKLAFEEARLWRSFDPKGECVLGDGLPGIIDRLFARLSEPGNHGALLVSHALGYLTAARYGLTEDEMLDVLAANDAVWEDFERTKKHEVPQSILTETGQEKRQLPAIVWSRLHLDLEPYLTERVVPGGTTISFYHRQLAERAASSKAVHTALAEYFARKPLWVELHKRADVRKMIELPFQQAHGHMWNEIKDTLSDLEFIEAAFLMTMSYELLADYQTTVALPELPLDIRSQTQEFSRFVQSQRHLLARHPGLTFQCAANEPDDSIVTQMAHLRFEREREVRPWLRWINKQPSRSACLATFEGHTKRVLSCAFSPDGATIASASEDRTVRLWETATGRELATMVGHSERVGSCCFSPDGAFVLSASHDGTVRLWEVATAHEVRSFSEHRGGVAACAFGPDGLDALSIGYDRTIRRRGVRTGQQIGPRIKLPGPVNVCCLSPDGNRAAVAFAASNMAARKTRRTHIWDLTTGTQAAFTDMHPAWVSACAFSPDGRWLVSGGEDGTIKRWDAMNGALLADLPKNRDQIIAFAVSTDGRTLLAVGGWVTYSMGGEVRHLDPGEALLFDAATGTQIRALPDHPRPVSACAVSADSRHLLTGAIDGVLRLWEVAGSERVQAPANHSRAVRGCAFSPDGARLVTCSEDGTTKVWKPDGTSVLQTLVEPSRYTTCCAFGPDPATVAIGTGDDTLRLYDLQDGHTKTIIPVTSPWRWRDCLSWLRRDLLDVPPIAGLLAICGGLGGGIIGGIVGLVEGLSAATKAGVWEVFMAACRGGVRWAVYASISLSGMYLVGSPLWSFGSYWPRYRKSNAQGCAFSPDGLRLAWVTLDGLLVTRDLCLESDVRSSVDRSPNGRCCTFSPDGTIILTGGTGAGTGGIWLVNSQSLLNIRSVRQRHPVKACSFSPDGERILIAAGALDSSPDWPSDVMVLSRNGGVTTMANRRGNVETAAYLPDGLWTACGWKDGSVTIHNATNLNILVEYRAKRGVAAITWSPSGSDLAVGDSAGSVYVLRLENVTRGRVFVTPWSDGASPRVAFGCPHCGFWGDAAEASIGNTLPCFRCGREIRLNAFCIRGDWHSVAEAWARGKATTRPTERT